MLDYFKLCNTLLFPQGTDEVAAIADPTLATNGGPVDGAAAVVKAAAPNGGAAAAPAPAAKMPPSMHTTYSRSQLKALIMGDADSGATLAEKEDMWNTEICSFVPLTIKHKTQRGGGHKTQRGGGKGKQAVRAPTSNSNDEASQASQDLFASSSRDAAMDPTPAAGAGAGARGAAPAPGVQHAAAMEPAVVSDVSSEDEMCVDTNDDVEMDDDEDEEESENTEPMVTPPTPKAMLKERGGQKKHPKVKAYTGESAALMDNMKEQSKQLRNKIVDPMEEILAAPAPGVGEGAKAGAGAGAGAVEGPPGWMNSVFAGRSEGRNKMTDHVDSGEQVDWDSDDLEDNQPRTTLPSMGASNAPSPLKRSNNAGTVGGGGAGGGSKRAKKRIRWDTQETNDLLAGIRKHGTAWGCWAKILSDSEFTFAQRTNQDLKDKYRNLQKNT
jgi:hypothetical protein